MKKVVYDHQPQTIEAVGNGSWLYRWNLETFTDERGTFWTCLEVLVWEKPTREKVKEAVIAALWPAATEAKLINDYNAANEGLLDVSYKQAYIDFITSRNALKTQIDQDFDNL